MVMLVTGNECRLEARDADYQIDIKILLNQTTG